MAVKTFTGPGNFNDNTKWDGATLPNAGDDLVITTGTCTVTANETNVYGTMTVNAGITIDLQTYNFTCGAATVSGTITIGSSADVGFTAAGLTFNAGSGFDLQTDSLILNSGDLIIDNSAIFTNALRGDYIQTASANISNPNSNNVFECFTLNDGLTLTLTNNSFLTRNGSSDNVINGVLAVGANWLVMGGGGSLTLGVNSDFTGNSFIAMRFSSALALTNNKTSAFSYTGNIEMDKSYASIAGVTGDWSNANYEVSGTGAAGDVYFIAGTVKCINFIISNGANGSLTIINSLNNPSFEISGNIDLNSGVGVYVTNWTKGTGTITLTGTAGTQTIASDSKSLEDIVINASGATKQIITTALTAESFTLTAGTIDHNTLDFTTGGNYSIASGGLNTDVGLNGITLTVGGNYSVSGAAGSLLDLGAGAGWTLTVSGVGRANYVTVKNSNAGGGSAITASNSTDEGSNTNWTFVVPGVANYYNPAIKVSKKISVHIA